MPETVLGSPATCGRFIDVAYGGGVRTPAAYRFRNLCGPRRQKVLGSRGFPHREGCALGGWEAEAVGGIHGSGGKEGSQVPRAHPAPAGGAGCAPF